MKNPKKTGKIISFSIALLLFIIANVLLKRINNRIKNYSSELNGIEKTMTANLSNLLIGKEDFRKGEFYITLGIMTTDNLHPVNGVFTPISGSMLRGLRSLKETLPEIDHEDWEKQFKEIEAVFNSAIYLQDINKFMIAFNAAKTSFEKISADSREREQKLASQKEDLKNKIGDLGSSSNLLLTINSIILLIQLFFTNLWDLYAESRKPAV